MSFAPLEADETERSCESVRKRQISAETWKRFEGYMAEIFSTLGMELSTPGTVATPARYLRALFDATAGYEGDPKLVTAFPTECRGGPGCRHAQVIEGPIPFYSLCEHHALPFFGQAWVGYIAHENIIGISKLIRLVRLYAARFSLQERIGLEVASALTEIVDAHGVAVYARCGAPVHADARRPRQRGPDPLDALARVLRGAARAAVRVLADMRSAVTEERGRPTRCSRFSDGGMCRWG